MEVCIQSHIKLSILQQNQFSFSNHWRVWALIRDFSADSNLDCFAVCRNPYRKITVSKESLFDVPKQFAVVADQDLSESHTILIMNQDLLKIKYTIHDAGTGSGTSSNANRAAMDAVDDNNMDEGENQTESESSVATSAEAHATRQKTLYHTEEWITKLRQALRSTLIIIENNTDFELHRSQWDLNRGIWRMIPPEKIAPQTRIMFGTESSGLGFDVGTFGRIIYTASSDKEAGGVFTLNWTNTFLFGISHQIGITSTSTQNGDVVADMEEKKDSAAAEVTFRIFQNKAQAEQAQEAVEPPNSSQQQVKVRINHANRLWLRRWFMMQTFRL